VFITIKTVKDADAVKRSHPFSFQNLTHNEDTMTQKFSERIGRLQRMLVDKNIDGVILNRSADIYYYTGSVQPLYLLVSAKGSPAVVARKAITRVENEVPHISLEIFSNSKTLADIFARHGFTSAKRVGMTLDGISYAAVNRLQRFFSSAELVDVSWETRMLRSVKSADEIAKLQRAGDRLAQLPQIIRKCFSPGMTELELSVELERFIRLHGHGGIMRCRREESEVASTGVCTTTRHGLLGTKFEGICTGQGLSPAAPFGANNQPIVQGQPMLIDISLVLEGYHSDQTRMFCWGEPSSQVMRAYEAMLQVERGIISELRPGRTWESVYQSAVEQAKELGYAKEFMGLGTEKVKFVGHGVGLELDEPPFLAPGMEDVLAEGMTLAIEPKVALPEIGVVGIEDTLVIEKEGAKILTPCSNDFIIC
jgi:Xaa-Pro aminopeptidase